MAPIITFTTDFGLRDPYVAEMKGVILGITGGATQLVDVTHEVQRHDVAEAALALEAAAPYFPAGTIHLAVVDPGVGTSRRGLVVAARGQLFVGPDNGLLTPFVTGDEWSAFEIASTEHRLAVVSRTFHGRDVFAPAAAYLAGGLAPGQLGPAVADPVRLAWAEMREVAGAIAGSVVHVDRFGNLVTSIHADSVPGLGTDTRLRVSGRLLRMVGTYGDLDHGEVGALRGSSGRLEIAAREASAAALLKARRGTPVLVSRTISPAKKRVRRLP
ncbi:MAG: SAM-dependent chlorinase/fluorinase [Candidatus Rokuibacteriota bacterium]